jgi:hypothetical protein
MALTRLGVNNISNSTLANVTALPAAISTGKVLQVVSNSYSTNVTTTSTSHVATGYTVTITPSSASNKILILVNGGSIDYDTDSGGSARLRWKLYANINNAGYNSINSENIGDPRFPVAYSTAIAGSFLYSPSTTNEVIIQPYIQSKTGDNLYFNRTFSTITITAMEVVA